MVSELIDAQKAWLRVDLGQHPSVSRANRTASGAVPAGPSGQSHVPLTLLPEGPRVVAGSRMGVIDKASREDIPANLAADTD